MTANNDPEIQYDPRGRVRHLLTLGGMTGGSIRALLDGAQALADGGPMPAGRRGVLANLFFEPSTRTRCSFEIAAGHLGWQVINVAEATSSLVKGESLEETVETLAAMGVDVFAVRHPEPAAARETARAVTGRAAVINAGGGSDDHPTQGLLDALTIRQAKGRVEGLTICLCGDVRHSRVARSDIHAFTALGAHGIRLVGPPELLPDAAPPGCELFNDFEAGIRDADVVIMLRLQKERMATAAIPDADDYHGAWGMTEDKLRLAKPDCLVMHPGPANPGVEITRAVMQGPQSAIHTQVRNGVYVRAHLLAELTRGT